MTVRLITFWRCILIPRISLQLIKILIHLPVAAVQPRRAGLLEKHSMKEWCKRWVSRWEPLLPSELFQMVSFMFGPAHVAQALGSLNQYFLEQIKNFFIQVLYTFRGLVVLWWNSHCLYGIVNSWACVDVSMYETHNGVAATVIILIVE